LLEQRAEAVFKQRLNTTTKAAIESDDLMYIAVPIFQSKTGTFLGAVVGAVNEGFFVLSEPAEKSTVHTPISARVLSTTPHYSLFDIDPIPAGFLIARDTLMQRKLTGLALALVVLLAALALAG
jgi:hypothetical protein